MTKYNVSLLKTKKVRCDVVLVKKSLEVERLSTESGYQQTHWRKYILV